jgi:transposase InsO family protein
MAQDTCYVGTIKGIGHIYQQAGIDTHCNMGFANVYREKTALTAADLMNDKVLPFDDAHAIRVLRVLTDNGVGFRGRQDSHSYELFLHLNGIEHTRTKIRRPQTNGSVERLNQTIQNEFYRWPLGKNSTAPWKKSRPVWIPSWTTTTLREPTRAATAKDEPLSRPL